MKDCAWSSVCGGRVGCNEVVSHGGQGSLVVRYGNIHCTLNIILCAADRQVRCEVTLRMGEA